MVISSPDAEITPRSAATAPASGIRTDTAPSTMTVSPAIHAITLDLDDTLWPMKPALIEAERALSAWMAERTPRASALLTPDTRAALRAGVVAEHPHRRHDVSFMRHELLRRAFAAAGDDPGLADEAFDVFLAARQRVTLYDDVVPVLARWAARYRLIAVTNGNADVARVGLGAYFSASVSAHLIGAAKPEARVFLAACQAAGTEPVHTLHIGDDLDADVVGARNAGLQAAWVRRADLRHPPHDDPRHAGTRGVFDSLAALDAHLHGAGG